MSTDDRWLADHYGGTGPDNGRYKSRGGLPVSRPGLHPRPGRSSRRGATAPGTGFWATEVSVGWAAVGIVVFVAIRFRGSWFLAWLSAL